MDQDGLIRVGGRIRRADVPGDVKHPVIIPRKGHLTELLIKHHHFKVNHMGRGMTHNELHQNGYWVINGSSGVARFISSCVTCRRLRRPTELQKMACLPEDRLEPASLFSYAPLIILDHLLSRKEEVKSNAMEYYSHVWVQEVFTWRLPIHWTVLPLSSHNIFW